MMKRPFKLRYRMYGQTIQNSFAFDEQRDEEAAGRASNRLYSEIQVRDDANEEWRPWKP